MVSFCTLQVYLSLSTGAYVTTMSLRSQAFADVFKYFYRGLWLAVTMFSTPAEILSSHERSKPWKRHGFRAALGMASDDGLALFPWGTTGTRTRTKYQDPPCVLK